MQKIGVYLSSKSDLPAAYRKAAEDVGAWLGRTGRTLVYGGARKGLGSREAVFRALACATIGIGRMPVVLYNAGGCWDSLLETLGRLKDDGLISEDFSELFAVVDDVEDLERLLA